MQPHDTRNPWRRRATGGKARGTLSARPSGTSGVSRQVSARPCQGVSSSANPTAARTRHTAYVRSTTSGCPWVFVTVRPPPLANRPRPDDDCRATHYSFFVVGEAEAEAEEEEEEEEGLAEADGPLAPPCATYNLSMQKFTLPLPTFLQSYARKACMNQVLTIGCPSARVPVPTQLSTRARVRARTRHMLFDESLLTGRTVCP